MIVEEGVRSAEAAHPPTENPRHAEKREPERAPRGRVRRERPDGGPLKDSAERNAEYLISEGAIGIVAYEGMNEGDNWETRAGGVANRGPAAICIPAENLVGEVYAAYGVRARCKLHAARWHLEYVCSARCIEHVGPIEEACECLAILAVADETKAHKRRHAAGDAAHVTASASEGKVRGSSVQNCLHGAQSISFDANEPDQRVYNQTQKGEILVVPPPRVADDCIFYCYVVADIVGWLEIYMNGWRTTSNSRGRIQELSGKFRASSRSSNEPTCLATPLAELRFRIGGGASI